MGATGRGEIPINVFLVSTGWVTDSSIVQSSPGDPAQRNVLLAYSPIFDNVLLRANSRVPCYIDLVGVWLLHIQGDGSAETRRHRSGRVSQRQRVPARLSRPGRYIPHDAEPRRLGTRRYQSIVRVASFSVQRPRNVNRHVDVHVWSRSDVHSDRSAV